MKFYLARDTKGQRHLLTVRTEAKSMDKEFQELEIGVDKPSLQAALQELLTEADTLNAELTVCRDGQPGKEPSVNVEASALTKDVAHDNRCIKCHTQLVLTEDGAAALADGVDMSALADWIETVPMWAVNGIAAAINDRRAAEAAAAGATSDMKAGGGEIDPAVEQTTASEA